VKGGKEGEGKGRRGGKGGEEERGGEGREPPPPLSKCFRLPWLHINVLVISADAKDAVIHLFYYRDADIFQQLSVPAHCAREN